MCSDRFPPLLFTLYNTSVTLYGFTTPPLVRTKDDQNKSQNNNNRLCCGPRGVRNQGAT